MERPFASALRLLAIIAIAALYAPAAPSERNFVFFLVDDLGPAWRTARLARPTVKGTNGKLELFNLRRDLSEKYNLVRLHPDKTEQLHGKLKAWREDLGGAMPTPNARYKAESR